MSFKMFSLIVVFCCVGLVFSRSAAVQQKSVKVYTTSCCRQTYFEYDVCDPKFQTESKEVGKETTEISKYNKDQLQEIRTITRDEINAIKRLMKKTERKIKCNHQLQRLKGKKLSEVVQIRILTNELYFQNITSPVTTTYLEVAKVTHLLGHLESTLFHSVKECCLPYPSENMKRLENRILMKWFNINKGFGEPIDVSRCIVNVQVERKESIGCDYTRDIIYLLLKETMKVLKHSLNRVPRISRK